MKKLELKHLAPYLPYGIKVIPEEWVVNDFWQNKKVILTGFQIDDDRAIFKHRDLMNDRNPLGIVSFKIEECQPILRPLSDLTEDTLHDFFKSNLSNYISLVTDTNDNGVIEADLMGLNGDNTTYTVIFNTSNVSLFPQGVFEYLLENHFDVFRLIDQGLAIDANTINK